MPDAARELSDATIGWAHSEARNVAMGRGLPEAFVLHCAQQVADEVFHRYMRRLEDGEIS